MPKQHTHKVPLLKLLWMMAATFLTVKGVSVEGGSNAIEVKLPDGPREEPDVNLSIPVMLSQQMGRSKEENPDYYLKLSTDLFYKKNYKEGFDAVNKAIRIRTKPNADDYRWRAGFYYQFGNNWGVFNDFNTVISICMEQKLPPNAEDYLWRSRGYYQERRYSEAAADARQVLALRKDLSADDLERLQAIISKGSMNETDDRQPPVRQKTQGAAPNSSITGWLLAVAGAIAFAYRYWPAKAHDKELEEPLPQQENFTRAKYTHTNTRKHEAKENKEEQTQDTGSSQIPSATLPQQVLKVQAEALKVLYDNVTGNADRIVATIPKDLDKVVYLDSITSARNNAKTTLDAAKEYGDGYTILQAKALVSDMDAVQETLQAIAKKQKLFFQQRSLKPTAEALATAKVFREEYEQKGTSPISPYEGNSSPDLPSAMPHPDVEAARMQRRLDRQAKWGVANGGVSQAVAPPQEEEKESLESIQKESHSSRILGKLNTHISEATIKNDPNVEDLATLVTQLGNEMARKDNKPGVLLSLEQVLDTWLKLPVAYGLNYAFSTDDAAKLRHSIAHGEGMLETLIGNAEDIAAYLHPVFETVVSSLHNGKTIGPTTIRSSKGVNKVAGLLRLLPLPVADLPAGHYVHNIHELLTSEYKQSPLVFCCVRNCVKKIAQSDKKTYHRLPGPLQQLFVPGKGNNEDGVGEVRNCILHADYNNVTPQHMEKLEQFRLEITEMVTALPYDTISRQGSSSRHSRPSPSSSRRG